jgi:integrase
MSQLQLFSLASDTVSAPAEARSPDADSARLLGAFRETRLVQGASPHSVRREVSQLRAIIREAQAVDPSVTPPTLLANIHLVACVLREPHVPIARSTGRARLLAAQRFIRIMGPKLGRDPATDLATLDVLLPARRSAGWHTTGTLVAGSPDRRRRRGPTLDAADLRRLVDAAGSGHPAVAARDRALVALHCFTGLRPEEIVRLRWGHLSTELTASGHYGVTAAIERSGRQVSLLLPSPAADALTALAANAQSSESLSGPIFRSRGTSDTPLSYRAARDVLQDACRRAGLPIVESTALRSACAHWLRSQGLSDHEVANVLGLARVRSVDRLLQRNVTLDAQRTVREILAR